MSILHFRMSRQILYRLHYSCSCPKEIIKSGAQIFDILPVYASVCICSLCVLIQIIAADGAANYIRPFLNALDEEEFKYFIEYHLATCERADLMGATGHVVDILRK